MKFLRKLEIGLGKATLVLALTVSVIIFGPLYMNSVPAQLLGVVVFFVAPALLVAVGSYFHAVQRKTSGIIMLWLGGLFLSAMFFVYLFGGAFYYELWIGAAMLTPSIAAIGSMIASLIVRRSFNKE